MLRAAAFARYRGINSGHAVLRESSRKLGLYRGAGITKMVLYIIILLSGCWLCQTVKLDLRNSSETMTMAAAATTLLLLYESLL